jgi:thiol-disulfide isomerase/thioredoxin
MLPVRDSDDGARRGAAMTNTIFRQTRHLTVIVALCLAARAWADVPPAKEVLDTALTEAKAEQKNVLVHFGASWCTWCRHLDAMLEGPELGQLFHDNYVITHLTILESDDKKALENPGALEMAADAGGGSGGVPFYIFFDSEGRRLATSMVMPNGGNIGHPVSPKEIKAFVGLLEKTAPRMTATDRNRVAEYLANQKH